MKGFYIRWGTIILVGVFVAAAAGWRYQQEVIAVSPDDILEVRSTRTVRVLGTVKPGSLIKDGSFNGARFKLSGTSDDLSVHYMGSEDENLRELKTLVVVGRFDPGQDEFRAERLAVVPNYGFIVAAYIVTIVSIGMFLFGMERQVRLLYCEIKETTVYEPEKVFDSPSV